MYIRKYIHSNKKVLVDKSLDYLNFSYQTLVLYIGTHAQYLSEYTKHCQVVLMLVNTC